MEDFRLILRIGVWGPEVRRAQRIDEGFDQWSTSRRAIDFLLRAALRLHALFFLPLHFFLALLERRFRCCHRISLNFALDELPGVRQKHCFVLPARLARLSRAIAVILVRESAALLPATAPVAAPFAPAVPVEPATTSASRPAGCGLWAGLIHLQIAPTDFFSVEAGNSFRRFRIVGHFHKCESAGSSRFTVRRNVDTRNLPEWFKQRAQIRLGRLKTHVADE